MAVPSYRPLDELDGDAAACKRYADEQLLQRPITPEEIGEAVLFLATSTATTGQALNVDGGWAFS
jgi:NAD(P)-dependent dehydrogenase (short-subunit alcohol dehydrogenase family)